MGGRGASSGTSKQGNQYGTQYQSLLTAGNVKYVMKTVDNEETLMETMTDGRVYAEVGNDGEVKRIVYFDADNKRVKQIDLSHKHRGMSAHVHHGYFHNENDSRKGATSLTSEEKRMVARILAMWKNAD